MVVYGVLFGGVHPVETERAVPVTDRDTQWRHVGSDHSQFTAREVCRESHVYFVSSSRFNCATHTHTHTHTRVDCSLYKHFLPSYSGQDSTESILNGWLLAPREELCYLVQSRMEGNVYITSNQHTCVCVCVCVCVYAPICTTIRAVTSKQFTQNSASDLSCLGPFSYCG